MPMVVVFPTPFTPTKIQTVGASSLMSSPAAPFCWKRSVIERFSRSLIASGSVTRSSRTARLSSSRISPVVWTFVSTASSASSSSS